MLFTNIDYDENTLSFEYEQNLSILKEITDPSVLGALKRALRSFMTALWPQSECISLFMVHGK
jgi:hypothetical protein